MEPATSWAVAQRMEGLAGEARVNLLRLVALVAFYGHHLASVYLLRDDPSTAGPYHLHVTVVAVAWAAAVLVVHLFVTARRVPPSLKYVATAWDLLLSTTLLVARADPFATLTVLYFLVIATAPLRQSVALVWFATLGSLAAYAGYMGYLRFVLEMSDGTRLPREKQVVVFLALAVAGLLADQVVRQCRRMVAGYPVQAVEES